MQEIKPRMLATPELLYAYWPQIEPLIATAPIAGDFSSAYILKSAVESQMIIFVFEAAADDGPVVELVLVLAPTVSETTPGFTLVTVAGKNLKEHVRSFWNYFKGWCIMNGARAIDAYVPERMEEFVKEELGLKRKSIHVRLEL